MRSIFRSAIDFLTGLELSLTKSTKQSELLQSKMIFIEKSFDYNKNKTNPSEIKGWI